MMDDEETYRPVRTQPPPPPPYVPIEPDEADLRMQAQLVEIKEMHDDL